MTEGRSIEVPWRIRVHPESQVGALSPAKLRELLRQARDCSFDFHAWKKACVLRRHYQVHAKTHCPRDGNRLAFRAEPGKRQRRAFFCERGRKLYRREDCRDGGFAPAIPEPRFARIRTRG